MPGRDEVGTRTVRLLRHAKSSWEDPDLDDHDRPLTARGVRAARLVARHLGASRASVDLVLCSSAVRARQTFDHILGSIGRPEVRFDTGIYLADGRQLWEKLRGLDDSVGSVLVVGHNPAMQTLAQLLIGGGDSDTVEQVRRYFPTAALATVIMPPGSWSRLVEGSGELQSFVLPRALEAS